MSSVLYTRTRGSHGIWRGAQAPPGERLVDGRLRRQASHGETAESGSAGAGIAARLSHGTRNPVMNRQNCDSNCRSWVYSSAGHELACPFRAFLRRIAGENAGGVGHRRQKSPFHAHSTSRLRMKTPFCRRHGGRLCGDFVKTVLKRDPVHILADAKYQTSFTNI